MNNKNTNIKIASLIEDVFTNCDIKERDKYIVKKISPPRRRKYKNERAW